MIREGFPPRHKMKVIVNNETIKTIKSVDFQYILKSKAEIRKDYYPHYKSDGLGRGILQDDYKQPKVEFRIVTSNVTKTKKPRYVTFDDIPDWTEHYGVNSENDYYVANEDYSRIKRLKVIT